MQAIVTYNEEKHVPVLTLSAENSGEEVTLALLAEAPKFKVVIELPEADELTFLNVIRFWRWFLRISIAAFSGGIVHEPEPDTKAGKRS